MNLERARSARPGLTLGERIGVASARDAQVHAAFANSCDLCGRGNRRHVDSRGLVETLCRVGHSSAVIPARRGYDAGCRYFTKQQIGERATRLERACVLQ